MTDNSNIDQLSFESSKLKVVLSWQEKAPPDQHLPSSVSLSQYFAMTSFRINYGIQMSLETHKLMRRRPQALTPMYDS